MKHDYFLFASRETGNGFIFLIFRNSIAANFMMDFRFFLCCSCKKRRECMRMLPIFLFSPSTMSAELIFFFPLNHKSFSLAGLVKWCSICKCRSIVCNIMDQFHAQNVPPCLSNPYLCSLRHYIFINGIYQCS